MCKQIILNPYNELYGILLALGNNFINRVPKEVLNNIYRNLSYKVINGKKVYDAPKYDLKVSLNIQGVSKDAVSMLYALYYNYWCSSDKEKAYLQHILKVNESKKEKAKSEAFKNTDVFANVKKAPKQELKQEVSLLIPIEKEKWYKSIFTKLSNLFNKK